MGDELWDAQGCKIEDGNAKGGWLETSGWERITTHRKFRNWIILCPQMIYFLALWKFTPCLNSCITKSIHRKPAENKSPLYTAFEHFHEVSCHNWDRLVIVTALAGGGRSILYSPTLPQVSFFLYYPALTSNRLA